MLAAPAFAWNPAGHMTTAAIAYDVLKQENPQAAAKVVELLKQHPQYETKWARKLEKVAADDRDQALALAELGLGRIMETEGGRWTWEPGPTREEATA